MVLSGGADWRTALAAASGSTGFDVVLDPVWGAPAGAAIGAMAPGGRLVTVGLKAGTEATFGVDILRRGLTVMGFDAGRCDAEAWTGAVRRLVSLLVAGEPELSVETGATRRDRHRVGASGRSAGTQARSLCPRCRSVSAARRSDLSPPVHRYRAHRAWRANIRSDTELPDSSDTRRPNPRAMSR